MALSKTPPTGYQCVLSYDTYVWQPAHTTTYVLPVYEIEQVIVKLNNIITNLNYSRLEGGVSIASKTISQLQNQTKNWQTVLNNYRSYNSDMTRMFNATTLH